MNFTLANGLAWNLASRHMRTQILVLRQLVPLIVTGFSLRLTTRSRCPVLWIIPIIIYSLAVPLNSRSASPVYDVRELPPPADQSYPYDINIHGDVVGEANAPDGAHAFIYEAGVVRMLGRGVATAINDLGEFAGFSYLGGSISGFIYRLDGPVLLDYTPDCRPDETYVWDINASGVAAGRYSVCHFPWLYTDRGFRLTGNTREDLRDGEDLGSEAYAINDRGQAVGYFREWDPSRPTGTALMRAALFSGNTPQRIVAWDAESAATDINNQTQVVGWWQLPPDGDLNERPMHAFRYSGGSSQTLFDGLANGINNSGQIVGYIELLSGEQHAVVWENGQTKDLNELIPVPSTWLLQSADAINDLGQIVGYGLHNGEFRAYILTPIHSDLVAVSLAWNNTIGGLDARYQVDNGALSTATTAKVFWASGVTIAAIVPGAPVIFTQNIPAGASGLSAVIPVPTANFANPPAIATHALLVLDPDNIVQESDEENNVMAIPLPLLGIDISDSAGPVTAFTWQALKDAGKKFVIVAGWKGLSQNHYAAVQLAGARNAQLLTAGYCLLNFRDDVDGRCQVKKALTAFGAEAAYLKFLAVDVEPAFLPPNYQSAAVQQSTVNRITEAVMEVVAAGLTPIIYSKQNDWDPMTGASIELRNLPLWLVNYDGLSYLPAVSFGGWTTSSAKQYFENTMFAGVEVDLNVCDPSLFSGSFPIYAFPPPHIRFNLTQGVLTLDWCDEDLAYILESSQDAGGPWSPVVNQANPFSVETSGSTAHSGAFFRLRSQ